MVLLILCFPLTQSGFWFEWDRESVGYFVSFVVHQGRHGDCSLSDKEGVIFKSVNSTNANN